ncbi:MAG: tetratricopeptide repeat protein [Thainema sp.]
MKPDLSIIKLSSEEADLYFQASLQAFEQQDFAESLAYLERVMQSDFDFWQIWYQRGLTLQALGRYQDAIANYQAALQLAPPTDDAASIWYDRADALHYGLGEYDTAIAAYDQVIQIDRSCADAWFHRGSAQLYGLRQAYAAIASYNQVLSIDPSYDLLWYNRGNALAELGFYHAALTNYDRALALTPDNAVIQQARMQIISQLSDDPSINQDIYEKLDWEKLSAVPTAPQESLDDPANFVATLIQYDTLIQKEALSNQTHPDEQRSAISTRTKTQFMILVQDSEGLRRIVLDEPFYSIGRDASCDIRLYSKYASRQHAVLVLNASQPHGYRIQDGDGKGKQSTNGLIVNGQECRDRILENGDTVVFGPKVWLRYVVLES